MTIILYLGSNPAGAQPIDLDKEERTIDFALRLSKCGSQFTIQKFGAVTIDDLHDLIPRFEPQIVHFGGHGDVFGDVFLERADGRATAVSTRSLASLFRMFPYVRCVILNTCDSAVQADIGAVVECVVAMNDPISDDAAIAFAFGFYRALGDGRSVAEAFELGRVRIGNDIPHEASTPVLRGTVDPAGVRFADASADTPPRSSWSGISPYLGLESFRAANKGLYFGREAVVADLHARLNSARFVCVAGPSGSGKSSLVRAGILPELHGATDGLRPPWIVLDSTPGGDPAANFISALDRAAGSPIAGEYLRDRLPLRVEAVYGQLEALLTSDPRQRCLVFVDQFEELFTEVPDETARKSFVDLLTGLADRPGGRTSVILAIRSEFVTSCAPYVRLSALMSQQFLLVGSLTPAELAQAITRPALEVGAEVEPALVETIIHDMDGEPGALPLMQFALKDLFDAQHPAKGAPVRLTLARYLQRGGIREALGRHADEVFARLSPNHQALAQHILVRLVDPSTAGEATRRTRPIRDLVSGDVLLSDVEDVVALLSAPDARLLTTDVERRGGVEPTPYTRQVELTESSTSPSRVVTLAHEKLVGAWPTLGRIVDDRRDLIRIEQNLSRDVGAWIESGRDTSFLYAGARLERVLEWVAEGNLRLSLEQQAFIDASKAREHRIAQEKEAALQRELERSRQDVRRRARTVRALQAMLAAILVPGTAYAMDWRDVRQSPWRRDLRFPADAVLSIGVSGGPVSEHPSGTQICAGTQGLGIGCSRQLSGWNIAQQGLPAGQRKQTVEDRPWSGVIRSITAVGIDSNDARRVFAYAYDRNIYRSSDGGASWVAVGQVSFDNAGDLLRKLFVVRRTLIGIASPTFWDADDHMVMRSLDDGQSWHVIARDGEGPFGKVRDAVVSADGSFLIVAADAGLFQTPLEAAPTWRRIGDATSIRAVQNDPHGEGSLLLATFDGATGGQLLAMTKDGFVTTLSRLTGRPRALAVGLDESNAGRVYILHDRDGISMLTPRGAVQPVGEPGGLFLRNRVYDIATALDSSGRTMVIAAHSRGLLTLDDT